MKRSPCLLLFLLAVVCLPSLGSVAAPVGGDDWRAVDPAELSMKTSTVEKDADAEALFWDVRLDDSGEDLVLNHYVRIKIFTDRGKETQSKVQIPFGKFFGEEIKIRDIAARTIKADGTIVELKKDDVFESIQVKAGGAKLKVKAFAVPGIEPGAIIEYRWREVRVATSANRIHLDYQRDIPVQRVTYKLKPSPDIVGTFRMQMFNENLPPMQKEKDGYFSISLTNVAAFHEEPNMPPDDQVKVWMLVYYTKYEKIDPAQYWRDHSKALHEISKEVMKVNDDVKRAAAEAVGDANSPEEKLRRIFDYSRTKIKNVNDGTLKLTPEERAKVKNNKTPSDTLKRGLGDAGDIDALFAAMCVAAGFDARLTAVSNRGRIFFRPNFADSYFLRGLNVAVKVGEEWRFFDPASMYVPYGMLPWEQEGLQALLADAKETTWVKTPQSTPEKSGEKRTGKFKLSDDGTLEGDVTIQYIGHSGAEKKGQYDDKSDSEREKEMTDDLKARLSTAELTSVLIENATDRIKPLIFAYHIKVPGYAQRTGKRLFLQPGFFERGVAPLFSTNARKNDVYFHYPWSEKDEISIELPVGFTLDNADAPAPIPASMTQGICSQSIKMGVDERNHTLVYQRDFFFGGRDSILFPVASYGALKNLFDSLQKANDHTITLKQGAN
jgi:transglutaminase-like putative cysteine protease